MLTENLIYFDKTNFELIQMKKLSNHKDVKDFCFRNILTFNIRFLSLSLSLSFSFHSKTRQVPAIIMLSSQSVFASDHDVMAFIYMPLNYNHLILTYYSSLLHNT